MTEAAITYRRAAGPQDFAATYELFVRTASNPARQVTWYSSELPQLLWHT